MLKQAIHCNGSHIAGGAQRGVTLVVALIVLVVMMLGGIALIRSMDTTNLIAGNLAFKQAATISSDQGVEAAIGWLEANNTGSFLDSDHPEVGYSASALGNTSSPYGEAFWAAFQASGICYLPMAGGVCAAAPGVADADTGNTNSFMIQRLCGSAGNRNGAGCSIISGTVTSAGNNEGAGEEQITGAVTGVYYRITVRVQGPRNTVSYVQAIVSM